MSIEFWNVFKRKTFVAPKSEKGNADMVYSRNEHDQPDDN